MSRRFATLSELLSANPTVIADYAGWPTATALLRVRGLMLHAGEEDLRQRQPIACPADAALFLKQLIGFRCDELLIVLFLDAQRRLIDYEAVALGRPDSVEFDDRRILLRAMGRGAVGLIIAHNHPSGDPRPSRSDAQASRRLAHLAGALDICLHDHLVVAGGEVRSAMFGG